MISSSLFSGPQKTHPRPEKAAVFLCRQLGQFQSMRFNNVGQFGTRYFALFPFFFRKNGATILRQASTACRLVRTSTGLFR
jgi:hypothetical protein